MTNCIVYYNNALVDANYTTDSLNYCCTMPLPGTGSGNITAAPQLADDYHLSAGSPCIGAGNPAAVSGVDIDGEPWASPPAIGCDEFYTGAATGQLSVTIQAAYTNLAIGFADDFTAEINGHAAMTFWDFGDGIQATNQPYIFHSWATTGDYQVLVWAFNQSNPAGVNATITVHVVNQPIQYVALSNSNPIAPYISWGAAATNIQDAVDDAFGGGLILVSNGVYNVGGRVFHGSLTNRLVINKAVTVESVNGPGVTMIQGYQVPGTLNGDSAVRCVYLASGATLAGFTLTNGATRDLFSGDAVLERSGGGVWCENSSGQVSNCVIICNSCYWYGAGVYSGTVNDCQIINNTNQNGSLGGGGGAAYSTLLNSTINGNYLGYGGAGAFSCALSNCVIAGNTCGGVYNCVLNSCIINNNTNNNPGGDGGGALQSTLNNCLLTGNVAANGGGAYGGTLNNSTLVDNIAGSGGGAAGSTLNNCIIYYNSSPSSGTFNYCCTVPLPSGGFGNITNIPAFVNLVVGNFHLQSNSPCINAGNNAYVTTAYDLDGNPRIVGGTVDIGAYEYQSPSSILSYAWAQQYGLPTDGSADFAYSNGNGFNNWQEWHAGMNPFDPSTQLKMFLSAPTNNSSGITITWQSVNGVNYFLQRGSNLAGHPPFSTIQSNIIGQAETMSYTDTNAIGNGAFFYRVGVQ
jgi:low affinity Fe/Cu permease